MPTTTAPTTIDAYLATLPRPTRTTLGRVRRAIRQALPRAAETISYRIPAFTVDGRVVIYLAAWKAHFSIYPATDRLVAAFRRELDPYEVNGKGTIRFPLSEAPPVDLIASIARFRAQEVAGKAAEAAMGPTRTSRARPRTPKKTAAPRAASRSRATPPRARS